MTQIEEDETTVRRTRTVESLFVTNIITNLVILQTNFQICLNSTRGILVSPSLINNFPYSSVIREIEV